MKFDEFCTEYCTKYSENLKFRKSDSDWLDFVDDVCTCCPYVEMSAELMELRSIVSPPITDICVSLADNSVLKYSNVTDAAINQNGEEFTIKFHSKLPLKIKEDVTNL